MTFKRSRPDHNHPYRAPASREERLRQDFARLQAAYHAGNEGALFEALIQCLVEDLCQDDPGHIEFGWPAINMPRDEVEREVNKQRNHLWEATCGMGRTSRWLTKYRQDLIHWVRYDTVLEVREQQARFRNDLNKLGVAKLTRRAKKQIDVQADYLGRSWLDAYRLASEVLSGTPVAGGEAAVAKSYKLVNALMETEPHRYLQFRWIKILKL